ncbi:hypothetical protein J4Q44_G00172690 [Coregonus suidteri]|uniref:Uncharacterized protein n=1 Tax=Coregonus suidteri TaxID=861788 RepID=A0AAN8LSS4_9TELE
MQRAFKQFHQARGKSDSELQKISGGIRDQRPSHRWCRRLVYFSISGLWPICDHALLRVQPSEAGAALLFSYQAVISSNNGGRLELERGGPEEGVKVPSEAEAEESF